MCLHLLIPYRSFGSEKRARIFKVSLVFLFSRIGPSEKVPPICTYEYGAGSFVAWAVIFDFRFF